jgi:phosphate:Na+ symporter
VLPCWPASACSCSVGASDLGSALQPRGGSPREFTTLVVALDLLLFGLDLMRQGVERFATRFDASPFAGLPLRSMAPLGVAVTAVIQSSSAAMMIARSALHGGELVPEAAAAFAAGSGVSTTVKAMIGAVDAVQRQLRTALAMAVPRGLNAILLEPASLSAVDATAS